jgi:DNA-binding MarR family transcriptional regulator
MGNNKNVSKKEYEMLASFRYALRQFLHFSEQAAIAAGITPQQHQALLAIKGYPGRDCILVRELAERLQIRHHSAVELIDRLVRHQFVIREHTGSDHRQVHVRLARRGEMVLAKLSEAHHEQLKRIGSELSPLLKRLGER